MSLNRSSIIVCRTCLAEGELKSVFEKNVLSSSDGMRLCDMIMECASIKISQNDGLPSNICVKCIVKLNEAYSFKKQCENADVTLQFEFKNDRFRNFDEINDSLVNFVTTETLTNRDTVDNVHGDYHFTNSIKSEVERDCDSHFNVDINTETLKYCTVCREQFSSDHVCIVRRSLKKKRKKNKYGDDKKNVGVKGNEMTTFSTEKKIIVKKVRQRRDNNETEQSTICNICNKRYTSKQSLRKHQQIHGEKTFLCSSCGKGFVSKALLRSHSKVHTGLKPYQCTTCGKSFSQLGMLKNHTYLHTGEKPFKCKLCGKAFTQRYHVVDHMRTHSGERPYACTVCDKTFAHKATLTVHLRTHTGETPYHCPACGRGFSSSTNMSKHRKRHDSDRLR